MSPTKLQYDAQYLDDVSEMKNQLIEIDKRLIKIETQIEMNSKNKQTAIQTVAWIATFIVSVISVGVSVVK